MLVYAASARRQDVSFSRQISRRNAGELALHTLLPKLNYLMWDLSRVCCYRAVEPTPKQIRNKSNVVLHPEIPHERRLRDDFFVECDEFNSEFRLRIITLHRLKSEFTMMFSIIWGFVDIDCNSLFNVIDCESVHTRGHNLRLYKEHCNVNCRLNAFVCRNINVWNRLPAHVVNSDSVAVFKRRLACVNLVNFSS